MWSAAFLVLALLPALMLVLPTFPVSQASPLRALDVGPMLPSASLLLLQTMPSPVPLPTLRWMAYLTALPGVVWVAGVLLSLLKTGRAVLAVRRLRDGAREWTEAPLVEELRERIGVRSQVRVLLTGAAEMPMSWGLRRHEIYLPAEATEWSRERLRVVLLHELFHVRRGDVALQLAAGVGRALYWYHPLAWLGWQELMETRERATDDLVLGAGVDAAEYSGELVDIAREMRPAGAAEALGAGIAGGSMLELRIGAILNPRVRRRAARAALVFATALAAFGALTLRTHSPGAFHMGRLFTPRQEDSRWALEFDGTKRQYLSPLPKEGGSTAMMLYTSESFRFSAEGLVRGEEVEVRTSPIRPRL